MIDARAQHLVHRPRRGARSQAAGDHVGALFGSVDEPARHLFLRTGRIAHAHRDDAAVGRDAGNCGAVVGSGHGHSGDLRAVRRTERVGVGRADREIERSHHLAGRIQIGMRDVGAEIDDAEPDGGIAHRRGPGERDARIGARRASDATGNLSGVLEVPLVAKLRIGGVHAVANSRVRFDLVGLHHARADALNEVGMRVDRLAALDQAVGDVAGALAAVLRPQDEGVLVELDRTRDLGALARNQLIDLVHLQRRLELDDQLLGHHQHFAALGGKDLAHGFHVGVVAHRLAGLPLIALAAGDHAKQAHAPLLQLWEIRRRLQRLLTDGGDALDLRRRCARAELDSDQILARGDRDLLPIHVIVGTGHSVLLDRTDRKLRCVPCRMTCSLVGCTRSMAHSGVRGRRGFGDVVMNTPLDHRDPCAVFNWREAGSILSRLDDSVPSFLPSQSRGLH